MLIFTPSVLQLERLWEMVFTHAGFGFHGQSWVSFLILDLINSRI
jgi:hypothetical protein